MFNIQGISLIVIIVMFTAGLAGWFLAKDYYMDADTEVLVKAIKHMSPKHRETIIEYIFNNNYKRR